MNYENNNPPPEFDAVMLRQCAADMTANGGFVWPREGLVTAPGWNPEAVCGQGLHGWLNGEGDPNVSPIWGDDSAVWLVARVVSTEVVDLEGKVKVPRAWVVLAGTKEEATAEIYRLCGMKIVIAGTATAGEGGTATAGYAGTATAGEGGTATAGNRGTATAGYAGTATAGNRGTATAGYAGTATAGEGGTVRRARRSPSEEGGAVVNEALEQIRETRERLQADLARAKRADHLIQAHNIKTTILGLDMAVEIVTRCARGNAA